MERPLLAQEAGSSAVSSLSPRRPARESRADGPPLAGTAAADRTEINLIFFIIAFAAVDATVAIPSLWPYMKQLGGTQFLYGTAGAVTNAVQIFSLPFFGWLSDKFSRKSILLAGHGIMALGGLLYGAAGTIGPGNTALAAVILARMLIGFANGSRSSAQVSLSLALSLSLSLSLDLSLDSLSLSLSRARAFALSVSLCVSLCVSELPHYQVGSRGSVRQPWHGASSDTNRVVHRTCVQLVRGLATGWRSVSYSHMTSDSRCLGSREAMEAILR